MKKLVLILSTLAVFGFLLGSCGGGDNGGVLKCDEACTKQEQLGCLDVGETLAGCLAECKEMSNLLLSEAVTALNKCVDKTTCAEIDTCFDQAMSSCTGDISGAIDDICTKVIECHTDMTMEECKAEFEGGDAGMLKCIKSSVISAMVSCITALTCDDQFDTNRDNCMNEQLPD